MKNSKSLGLLVLLLLVLVTGCKPAVTPPPVTSTQVQAEPTATPVPPTSTPTASPSPTPTTPSPTEPVAVPEGGGSWTVLHDLDAHRTGMAGFLDDSLGITVGHLGEAHYTTDGGQTWAWGASNTGGTCLYGLDIVNENLAWSVGYRGKVRVSTDGGQTWQSGPLLSAEKGYYISFLDDRTGWTASFEQLWATSDAETWTEITLPQGVDKIAAIALRTPSDGYLLDYAGALYVTQDGGDSWAARTLELGNERVIDTNASPAMRFFDAEHGLIVLRIKSGSAIVVLRTADGGETWEEESVPVEIESYQMKLFLSPDGISLTITAQEGKIVVLRYQGV